MSRVAKAPVLLPAGVEVDIRSNGLTEINVKGAKGSLSLRLSDQVDVSKRNGSLAFQARGGRDGRALAGTVRSLVQNMVVGVSEGFQKRLEIQGVGYRAQAQGRRLNLQLGFSHPIDYELPEGIDAETASPTEIVVKGIDKQLVGQVCAEIRALRPPEPYKGKGVRYAGEHVRRKEGKKK